MIDPFWNLAHKLYKKEFRRLGRFFEILSMTISSHAVSAQIEIGEGSRFWHHGLGCVALQTVHIGKNCVIGAGCIVRGEIPDGSVVVNKQDVMIR